MQAVPRDADLPVPTVFEAVDGNNIDPELARKCHVNRGAYACAQSHKKIIEISKAAKHDIIWILEDDATFAPNFYTKFLQVISELPEDWELLFLGANYQSPRTKITEHISKATSYSTHSYIINNQSNIFERIIGGIENLNSPVDVFYCYSLQPTSKTYYAEPRLCGQTVNFSDILNTEMNSTAVLGAI